MQSNRLGRRVVIEIRHAITLAPPGALAERGYDATYGNGFKPSSFKKPLCLSFAAAIAFSISSSS